MISFLTVVRRHSTKGGATRCLRSLDIMFPVATAQILGSDIGSSFLFTFESQAEVANYKK